MRKFFVCALLAASWLGAAPKKPKLVLAIVIDQFRYDYLTRFRDEYHAGLNRLLTRGAVFTSARYIQFPTLTATGHSTFLTGATPSVSGIVANEWYDRDEHRHVTSVSDEKTRLLGGTGTGSSPHRLLVSTVTDELKLADEGKSHVIGISLKDRAAILPAGHTADAAYWFDLNTGNFASSTYYFKELPAWVQEFNRARPADRYSGAVWLHKTMPAAGKELYPALDASPFGNELVERFVERALEAEQLGKHQFPDVLAVSFSSIDYVGHRYGPYSAEEHDMVLRADQVLEQLFRAADRQVGLDNVLVVLTSDHGVAPSAQEAAERKMPGGRIAPDKVSDAVTAALVKKYGAGDWVLGTWDLSVYLNEERIAQRNLDPRDVETVAAQAVYGIGHIFRVYTRQQLLTGAVPGDETSHRMANGFHVRRGANLLFLPDPYWIVSNNVASHGTTFGYDTHVPVIFMGPGIHAGRYDQPIAVNDVAPTLASLLEVETPSGSVGRILAEMFGQ